MNPLDEYQKRLASREALRDRCWAQMKNVGWARLGFAVLFLGVIWQSFTIHIFSGWFALVPAGIFVVFAIFHERLRRAFDRAKRGVAYYKRGLDRLEDRWQGKGNAGVEFGKNGHLYSTDLDILGDASLFELLCTARTRAGEETLARWLCAPASRSEILKRQEAVKELRDDIDLREDLALIGPEVREGVDPVFMSEWASRPSRLNSSAGRTTASILVGALFAAIAYDTFSGGSPMVLLAAVLVEAAFALLYRSRVREAIGKINAPLIDEPVKELAVLGSALQRMEREDYSSEKLRQFRENFAHEGKRPSQEIATVVNLVEYLNYRRNEFFFAFSLPLLWATRHAFAIEAWRVRCGPQIPQWLENFGEFEALCALAGYAYEHPDEPFPEIVEGDGVLEGEDLRHPLIAASACVPNSIQLGGELRLLLVSGSNMSGKSTLLRTVGINAVLAQAGGPVRAKRMKLSVLAIGATMRVQDSLQAGVSRFYAEIQRLHDTMELTSGSLPVLFLLDEILHGTNSHDRAIGAEAIVRGLIERGAIGLVTTHDLALARVVDALEPRARNVHFEDHLENGRMTFDYILHPGVVQKSNALELMRAVGLKV